MTDKPAAPKLGIVSPSLTNDASDIEALWLDPAPGDGLTDTNWHTIPVDKPKDFFRVHPDPDYRRVPKSMPTRPKIETTYYILGGYAGTVEEARPWFSSLASTAMARRAFGQLCFPRGRKGQHSLVERQVRGTHCNRQVGETGLDWALVSDARRAAGIRTRPGLDEVAVVQRAGESIQRARRDPRHHAPDLSRVDGSAGHA